MNKRRILTLLLVMVSTVFFYASASGQTRQNDIAQISNNGSSVSWAIKGPYETATLTVSTPNGEVIRREFKAGTNPTFFPTSERGEFYGNGRFSYEIVLTPSLSKEAKAEMDQSRLTGNSREVIESLRKRGLMPMETTSSGTFTFQDGTLFTSSDPGDQNLTETTGKSGEPDKNPGVQDRDVPVDNAQVIVNDLVVQGSTCTGFDCVNGESFGFDTLRLKENNLRLHFLDTSTSASFPSNDWRIVANDTSNGGANYLAFEDSTAGRQPFRVTAGAPANSLFVDSQGDVGLGTSTPVLELHVVDGDTPSMRLEQNGSSGFTAQTWDIAGNESNFFIRDVTNGSRLPFKIRPGAATDSLVIEANGDVSIKSNIILKGGGTQSSAPLSALQFYGGQAVFLGAPSSNITPAVDTNSFGVTTNGQNGFASFLINIPSNLNLSNTSASNVVYKIRYHDPDGAAAGSLVSVSLVANGITGARNTKTIFSSNSFGTTTETTITICEAVDTTYFNYATSATHLSVVLVGTAALTAKFIQVQVYKISVSC